MPPDFHLLKEFKEAFQHYKKGEMKEFDNCLERILLGYSGDVERIERNVMKALGKEIKEVVRNAP